MSQTKTLSRLLPLSGAFILVTALTAAASAIVLPVVAGKAGSAHLSALYLDESGLSYTTIDRLDFSK